MTDYVFMREFRRAVRNKNMTEISDLLHVSKLTLAGWKIGKNLPYRMIRGAILRVLRKAR